MLRILSTLALCVMSTCQKDGSDAASSSASSVTAMLRCPDGATMVNGIVWAPSFPLETWKARGALFREHFAKKYSKTLEFCTMNSGPIDRKLPSHLESLHPAPGAIARVRSIPLMLPDAHGPGRIKTSSGTLSFNIIAGKMVAPLHWRSPTEDELLLPSSNGRLHGKAIVRRDAGLLSASIQKRHEWIGNYEHGRLVSSTFNGQPEVVGGKGAVVAFATAVSGQFENGLPSGTWHGISGTTVVFDGRNATRETERSLGISTSSATKRVTHFVDGLKHGEHTLTGQKREMWQTGYKTKLVDSYKKMLGSPPQQYVCHYDSGVRHGTCQVRINGILRAGQYKNGVPDGEFVYTDSCDKELARLSVSQGNGQFRTYDADGVITDHVNALDGDMFSDGNGLSDALSLVDAHVCIGELVNGTWTSLSCRDATNHEALVGAYDKEGALHGTLVVRSSETITEKLTLLRETTVTGKHGNISGSDTNRFLVQGDNLWRFAKDHWTVKSVPMKVPCGGYIQDVLVALTIDEPPSCEQSGAGWQCSNLRTSSMSHAAATFEPCKPAHIKADKVWCQK